MFAWVKSLEPKRAALTAADAKRERCTSGIAALQLRVR
jgi:hypothetical protein